MTKAEIREAYNNLTPVLQSKVDNYKAITGCYYEGIDRVGNMAPSVMMDYKDTLESRLERREALIKDIEEATIQHQANQVFLSTDEGRKFLSHLVEKKEELVSKYEQKDQSLIEKFSETLVRIGLSDWKIINKTFNNSVTLVMGDSMDINIRVGIECRAGKYYIEPSSGLLCGHVENRMYAGNTKSPQYLQFKACCVIVENGEVMEEFLNFYKETNKEMKTLKYEMDKVNEWICNPVDAYKK